MYVCARLGTLQPWATQNVEIPDTRSSSWNTATFSLRPIINNKKMTLEVLRNMKIPLIWGLSSLSPKPLCFEPFQTTEEVRKWEFRKFWLLVVSLRKWPTLKDPYPLIFIPRIYQKIMMPAPSHYMPWATCFFLVTFSLHWSDRKLYDPTKIGGCRSTMKSIQRCFCIQFSCGDSAFESSESSTVCRFSGNII